MTFLRSLLNAGVDGGDAQVLEKHYANEPEFLDGLEIIARAMAINQPVGLIPPAGEPWRTFHGCMLHAPDINQAFMTAVGNLPADLQIAISGAISTRMAQLQQYNQHVQGSTGKRRKSGDYLKMLKNLGYAFKYNLCSQSIEVNGHSLSDPLAAEIRTKLRDVGVEHTVAAEDAYLSDAWQNRYHPLRDYFAGLKYEGQDVIGELTSYIQDTNGMFPAFFKRWLIGSVARVMTRAQNRMLVLDGPQGIGKDYFARWLCSPMPEFYHEGAISPDDKDCRLRLLSTWIWTVSELGATTRRSDREALKSFLTLETVRDRKPFGKYDIQGAAITSFIGTINNEGGFLSDPTGNRRFMTVKLAAVDWGYTKLEVDQIWAQGYDLYLSGEPWDLQPDESKVAAEINEVYETDDLTEAAILKYFTIDPKQTTWWMPTVDIVEHLEIYNVKFGSPTSASMAIGRAMTSIGLIKIKKQNNRGQWVNGYVGIAPI